MGGVASKAGRKLPKRTEAPSWAGVRTPHSSDPPPENPLRDRRASERRTQEIERDAHDPHFLANLNRLGPVRVDHHMERIRPSTAAAAKDISQLFKSRLESEHEASSTSPVHNRLHAVALSYLLDERKSACSTQDIERLAKRYDIDASKLENLARYVSTPSVQRGSEKRTVEKDGQEDVTIQAVWIDPQLQE
ncbi:hypothetical protein H2248_009846 [Termitomyces sp. 'cryptogamus']|nr:hypothetical protein H2248_009846 [Termitomyces sp. 'cryptogamus']